MSDKRLFNVTGVLEYAHCFSAEVMAKDEKEARKKVEDNIDDYSDSTMAELQDHKIDDVEVLEDENE